MTQPSELKDYFAALLKAVFVEHDQGPISSVLQFSNNRYVASIARDGVDQDPPSTSSFIVLPDIPNSRRSAQADQNTVRQVALPDCFCW